MVQRVKQHYDGMGAVRETADVDTVQRDRDRETGRFGIGNRAGGARQKGIVSLIKEETNNYADLITNLVEASKGEEVHGRKPSYKDIMDATNSLLDRAIGKPTQQIIASVDDETKQLMADRLRLRVLEAEGKQGNQSSGDTTLCIESSRRTHARLDTSSPEHRP